MECFFIHFRITIIRQPLRSVRLQAASVAGAATVALPGSTGAFLGVGLLTAAALSVIGLFYGKGRKGERETTLVVTTDKMMCSIACFL